jgi:hypothetical protein
MSEVVVCEDNILGTNVIVKVTSSGYFHVYREGDGDTDRCGHGETMDAALAVAKTALSAERVKVNVRFRQAKHPEIVEVATGLHAGTGRVLYNGGQQYKGSSYETLRGDMSDDDVRRLLEIEQMIAEKQKLIRDNRFHVKTAVVAAIHEAQAAQQSQAAS